MGFFKGLGKKTIGFWAGDQNNFQFVDPLIQELSAYYKVKKFDYVDDVDQLKKELNSVNVAWFEWGNGPVVPATVAESSTPIISRLHRYELYSESPKHIHWPRVAKTIFSSPSMIVRFEEKFPEQFKLAKPELVPIGVDTNLFTFAEKPITKRLIYTGRIHPHKNPSILLQIVAKLVKLDPEYKLTVIGGFHDELYEEYFHDQIKKLGIKDNVEFLGKMTQPEMVKHLQGSDFFLITSIIEGLSQSSLEAMACGARPVIDDYYGSEKAYPKKFLYRTIDEAVEMIQHPVAERRECREFIEKNYVLSDKTARIKEIVDELLKK